jgi:nucleoside 2-deoxyribosyltransferase
MKIYLITPVRNASPELLKAVHDLVDGLERSGHRVHFPPRDVDQKDETGFGICAHHLAAMETCDKVMVWWDKASSGSHFDLGMAFALGKPVEIIHLAEADGPGKSYVKVMAAMQGGDYAAAARMKAFNNPAAPLRPGISLSEKKKAHAPKRPRR